MALVKYSGFSCRQFYGGGSVVVVSLFIVAPIVCGCSVFGPCFVMYYFTSFLVCNHLDEEERSGCFALIVILMS